MTEPSGRTSPTPLDYGPPPRHRRRWIWRAALLLSALAITHAVRDNWPAIRTWYSLVRIRNIVLRYDIPKGAVAMRQPPDADAKTWGDRVTANYRSTDATWREAEMRLIPMLTASPGSAVTLFLHELHSPAGHRRVVAINLSMSWSADGSRMRIDIRLFDPGTILKPRFTELTLQERDDTRATGTIPRFPGIVTSLGSVPWGNDFKLYCGRTDPADSSKFTIPYEFNRQRGTFVGQLHDDDSISLTCDGEPIPKRFPPPATVPATTQRVIANP